MRSTARPKAPVLGPDVRPRLIREGNHALSEIPTDRGFGGPSDRFFGSITRRLRDFSFKAEYAYDYGMPQRLARADHLLSPLRLEKHFLGRHKLTHYRVWYRDALAGYVRDILLDQRTLSRPYLERKRVEAIVNGHTIDRPKLYDLDSQASFAGTTAPIALGRMMGLS